jgi:hypothetical protein
MFAQSGFVRCMSWNMCKLISSNEDIFLVFGLFEFFIWLAHFILFNALWGKKYQWAVNYWDAPATTFLVYLARHMRYHAAIPYFRSVFFSLVKFFFLYNFLNIILTVVIVESFGSHFSCDILRDLALFGWLRNER